MYDADCEEFLANEEKYVTRDSGQRAEHCDGVVRDTQEGKVKFPLLFPKGIPMEEQLIVRVAELYTRGGDRYGDRNWENSSSEETLEHHLEALWRHFVKFALDVRDGEDHAAAVVWNINAVDLTRRRLGDDSASSPAPEPPPVKLRDCDDDVWTLNKDTGKWELNGDSYAEGISFDELLREWGPLTTGAASEPE